ncbi:collagenase-like protease [Thermoanaerobacter kivui]|uniref:Collagenase-like protease n=1 Tax=Thermoanaerobacter kivui TaxID=2325 RepID=A0A097ASE5_THEKI|nr:U32 family peptidase [Thermoanaerobacter kivui]AIS52743.1 collagenase-like protease [Thermoanaerobacter kivui]
MKKVELLAPAGNFEALVSAVNEGCDAVYLGGKNFGARAYAVNFDNKSLKAAVEFCHLRDVKVYVTVNTLILNEEFKELVDYLDFLYAIGVDAVIVQDIGVLKLLKEYYPDLKVHASTQMTVHNLEGVQELAEQGISRVILSRELTLKEIKHIAYNYSPLEIEVFVHGALCVSYSGQCFMSSLIGGRSGNRGKCAQPCRLKYSLVNKEGKVLKKDLHLLSMVDLCTLEYLPQLVEAGVSSFKIEGRMKNAEYVASVVRAYRNAIDSFYKGDHFDYNKAIEEMSRIFNRGFSTGYLFEDKPSKMSYITPKNTGVAVAKVIETKPKDAKLQLIRDIAKGDGISDIKGENGQKVDVIIKNGKTVDRAYAGDIIEIPLKFFVQKGDILNKTYDVLLNNELKNLAPKKLPIEVYAVLKKSQPLYLKVKEGMHQVETCSEERAQPALKTSIDRKFLIDKLSQINDTPFYVDKIHVEVEDGLYMSVKNIKETRRKAIETLEKLKIESCKRETKRTPFELPEFKSKNTKDVTLTFYTDKINHLKIACDLGIKYVYFNYKFDISLFKKALEWAQNFDTTVIPAFPSILREEINDVKMQLDLLKYLNVKKVLISNLGLYHIAKDYDFELFIDYPMNIFNSLSVEYFKPYAVTLSYELTLEQMKDIIKRSDVKFEAVVYGRLPLMTMEYCPIRNTIGCDKKRCEEGYYFLKDRKGRLMPLKNDGFCRIQILNSDVLFMVQYLNQLKEAGLSFLRINDTIEEDEEIKEVLKLHIKALEGENIQIPHGKYTKGHFYRGVL